MKRILVSLGMIVFVGAVVVGATGAFFSDTETSRDNTFTAGAIDLKLDSQSHYAGLVCDDTPTIAVWELENGQTTRPDLIGQPCDGTWTETDLGVEHTFFNFADLKPGDEGENTISIHVYDNDSWLTYKSANAVDHENGCNEAESESGDNSCGAFEGELSANLDWHVWLDQGSVPGFQNVDAQGTPIPTTHNDYDALEGDNIQNTLIEFTVLGGDDADNTIDGLWPFENGTDYFFAEALMGAYALGEGPALNSNKGCDDLNESPEGANNYGRCQGLAEDGRIVGSTTYYFGTAWCLGTFEYGTSVFIAPVSCDGSTVSNQAQGDSLVADNVYQVVQHRNNPGPNPTF